MEKETIGWLKTTWGIGSVVFNWQDALRSLGVNFEIWVQRRNTDIQKLSSCGFLYTFSKIVLYFPQGCWGLPPFLKIANLPFWNLDSSAQLFLVTISMYFKRKTSYLFWNKNSGLTRKVFFTASLTGSPDILRSNKTNTQASSIIFHQLSAN